MGASSAAARDGAAVVVCPPGLGDEAMRRAGRVACRGERPCTAWFWDDPALAPEAPPTPERPMSEAQADAAVAVYLADRTGGAARRGTSAPPEPRPRGGAAGRQ